MQLIYSSPSKLEKILLYPKKLTRHLHIFKFSYSPKGYRVQIDKYVDRILPIYGTVLHVLYIYIHVI